MNRRVPSAISRLTRLVVGPYALPADSTFAAGFPSAAPLVKIKTVAARHLRLECPVTVGTASEASGSPGKYAVTLLSEAEWIEGSWAPQEHPRAWADRRRQRRRTTRRHVPRAFLLAGLLLGAALVGCKSTGEGMGESRNGEVKVSFTWEQSEPTSGLLKATVRKSDGAKDLYQGNFYQITHQTRVETIGGLWDPWYPRWGGWAYWGPQPANAFIEHYTGHVVANLAGPSGQRMRCQFQLLRSAEGMKGGGQGQCQLPSGQTINAEFPPLS